MNKTKLESIRNTNPLYLAVKTGKPVDMSAHWNKSGNTKLGNMWTFSTLYGNEEHYISKIDMKVTGTCGIYCTGCNHACYVRKSYRYGSVIFGHARNTLAIRNDIEKAENDLNGYIDRAKKKPEVIRYNQSGEIENKRHLKMYSNIARKHPNITFYVYSKAYDIVIPALLKGTIPSNMVVLISIWHNFGIKEFKKVKHLKNVKAYVLVDNEFTLETYAKHGIHIQTMCNAYDIHGKMNKAISCMKCRKCFNNLESCQVIGCYEH